MVRLFYDMVAANLSVPIMLFVAYLLFVLIAALCRHPWFEPKDVPRSQPEAQVLGDVDVEAA